MKKINTLRDFLECELYEIDEDGQPIMTSRLIPGDDAFEYPEWVESGSFNCVPVIVYYRTTPEDQLIFNETGDFSSIDWYERIELIELDVETIFGMEEMVQSGEIPLSSALDTECIAEVESILSDFC